MFKIFLSVHSPIPHCCNLKSEKLLCQKSGTLFGIKSVKDGKFPYTEEGM